MKRDPFVSTARAAQIFVQMVGCRREYCADTDFFVMSDVWDYLCDGSAYWSIKTYSSSETEDYKRKAGVTIFDGRVRLVVDQQLLENARRGYPLPNFILAHELGHLELDHHSKQHTIKHFQLFADANGLLVNRPPTVEELEANMAAVFFQCGVALLDSNWEVMRLAQRAHSDPYYVAKARSYAKVPSFRLELAKRNQIRQRVIL